MRLQTEALASGRAITYRSMVASPAHRPCPWTHFDPCLSCTDPANSQGTPFVAGQKACCCRICTALSDSPPRASETCVWPSSMKSGDRGCLSTLEVIHLSLEDSQMSLQTSCPIQRRTRGLMLRYESRTDLSKYGTWALGLRHVPSHANPSHTGLYKLPKCGHGEQGIDWFMS